MDSDVQNIVYSLYKIAVFIRQRKLEDKTTTNISQITEFGFAIWNFISSIYESGWNKLTTNKDNRSFRQYVALQFKAKIPDNKSNANQETFKSGNKANVSRIPSPIPLRLSKKVFVMRYLNTNNFYFGQWRGMWYHSHMTYHMMWCHRPRTRWKDLEDDVRVYRCNIVALSKKWDGYEDRA